MDSEKIVLNTEIPGSSSPETRTSNHSPSNVNTSLTPVKTLGSDANPCNSHEAKDTNTTKWPYTYKHTPSWRPKTQLNLKSRFGVLRLQHTRRALLRQQISEGRADPYQTWCGNPSCKKDGEAFKMPYTYPVNKRKCRDGLPVEDYFHDLAEAMTILLFPKLKDDKEKARKRSEILSFIDSPPIRSQAMKMRSGLIWHRANPTDKQFEAALIRARPVFLDIMFGVKTAKRVEKVHHYLTARRAHWKKWVLDDYIVRFLISAEIWRRHETPRRESWVIGSREAVGEFLTAILLSYRQLFTRDCLKTRNVTADHHWDDVWQGWLDKYPLPKDDDDDFKLREKQDLTEEDVLEEIGYLGGVGKADETYKPIRNRPGEPDQMDFWCW
ncbi:hypothetical protein CDV36_011737 [Fusarium kuroshium]|uniref:Uncharacterized protein n=3 Tax=Fusarium solani species complex TaxID=232080 RepID=A0A3M2RTL5_9HYPO|nr:hypothetical protein CDV36_011737 [Fusarium kuroshium]RSL59043.1 hypothetical protein CEP51_013977 [Fusarium floridanum]RSL92472.1 hypothetical protein CDV31_015137 [Fusarium ambrosium]